MYFEINVSLNGQHFFATAERSVTDRAKLAVVLDAMTRAFPAWKGYEVSATEWNNIGERLNVRDILSVHTAVEGTK